MELSGLIFGGKPNKNVRFMSISGIKNPLIEMKDREPKTILVFAKDEALAGALKNQSDSRVILVTPDQRQTDQNLLTFCVNPEVTSDYIRLFEELEKRGFLRMSSCTREKHFTRVTAFSAAWNQFLFIKSAERPQ